jgi:hypothetical protein
MPPGDGNVIDDDFVLLGSADADHAFFQVEFIDLGFFQLEN